MNVVDFGIDYVINGPTDISPYLLELAFDNPNKGYGNIWGPINNEFSIEQGIREKVIVKMIGPLLNVAGGNTEVIDLTGANIKNVEGGIVHVNVPDFLTGGRRILSVIEVYPGNLNAAIANGYNFSGGVGCGTSGTMGNSMNRLINGLDNGNVQRTFTNISITGKNSFIIRDAGSAMFNMIAKVILSYDEHFSMIPPKMFDQFALLIEWGVKVYIYKNCRRGMREAVSKFGVTVDELMDDIQGYADAHIQFKEFFEEEIKKCLAYSDPKGVSDTIRMITPRKR